MRAQTNNDTLESNLKWLEDEYIKQKSINMDLVDENDRMAADLKRLKKKINGQRNAIRSKELEIKLLADVLKTIKLRLRYFCRDGLNSYQIRWIDTTQELAKLKEGGAK